MVRYDFVGGEEREVFICSFHIDVKIAHMGNIYQAIVVGIALLAYLMMKNARKIMKMIVEHNNHYFILAVQEILKGSED